MILIKKVGYFLMSWNELPNKILRPRRTELYLKVRI